MQRKVEWAISHAAIILAEQRSAVELPILCQECGTEPVSDVLRMVRDGTGP
jgi:hypothetical protein